MGLSEVWLITGEKYAEYKWRELETNEQTTVKTVNTTEAGRIEKAEI